MSQDDRSALSKIESAKLTSVCFVMDYLALGFDEQGGLTILSYPILIVLSEAIENSDLRYRNLLCELIGHKIESIEIGANESINIVFDNSWGMKIDIRRNDKTGEKVILTGTNNYLYVF